MTDKEYRKELIALLKSTPALRCEMDNYKIDLEELEDINTFRRTEDYIKASNPTHAQKSTVEREALRLIDIKASGEYKALEGKIKALERKLNKIDVMLSVLAEDDKRLIELKYCKGKPSTYLEDLFALSRQGIVSRVNKILGQLLEVYKVSQF